jgi:adenosylmethionine-8-amino-7-oxononanoate aminotransferase
VPGIGCADGLNGDTLALSPPFIITEAEIETVVATLEEAIDVVARTSPAAA